MEFMCLAYIQKHPDGALQLGFGPSQSAKESGMWGEASLVSMPEFTT